MTTPKVGYTQEAAREYKRIKPWSQGGLNMQRLGVIRDDVPSAPGAVSVEWDDKTIEQITREFVEERF